VGNLTCLGPAPSHILGIIAASFGWSSTNQPHNQKGRAPWPYATQLLSWVEANEPKVAARLLASPSRVALSVNGFKNAKTLENTRIQQTVLENPIYQLAVSLPTIEETDTLQAALKKPAFRICLGNQFCPGFIRELAPLSADTKANWALYSPSIGADSTPASAKISRIAWSALQARSRASRERSSSPYNLSGSDTFIMY
jgi:hypothetical protein